MSYKMTLYQHLITVIFLLSTQRISCFSVNEPLEMRITTPDGNESSQILNLCPSDKIGACSSGGTAELTLQSHTEEDIHDISHTSIDIQGSNGRKRKFTIDLNLPYELCSTESDKNQSKKQNIINQVDDSTHNQFSELQLDENLIPFYLKVPNEPTDTSHTRKEYTRYTGNSSPSETTLTNSNTPKIPEPVGLHLAPDSSSISTVNNASQKESNEKMGFQKYTFKQNGKSVLLPQHKVMKTGETWHMIGPQQKIYLQLKNQGILLSQKAGLNFAFRKANPWFQELEKYMQLQFYGDTKSPTESSDISRAILGACNHLTLGFLASLQMIHSPSTVNMKELTLDGWSFIQEYLGSWRQVNWKEVNYQRIDISRCSETFTAFQILTLLSKSSQSPKTMMCIIWSLCNSWYKASTYKNKEQVGTYENFLNRSYHYLAEKNLIPELEVEIDHTPSIYHHRCPSHEEIRRENILLEENRHKRTVSSMKSVGEGILKDLSIQGFSPEFIDKYCAHMEQKTVRFPRNWKGDFDSLKHRVKTQVIPCFLGMIQLLYPFESKKGQLNPIVLNGFQFLHVLLSGWEKDDLDRACQNKSWTLRRLETYDEASVVLLDYLLKLKPGAQTRLATRLFFGLWKVWQRWEGTAPVQKLDLKTLMEFTSAVEQAYASQVLLDE
ncbi:hypothetical protein DFH28DRAFT_403263 [Melampsora americana]|nr:hypothetical protein DFH28DRAFT_403263 [Melampsora americana]